MSNIGKKIYGFCNGFFGSSSYSDKVIVLEGLDWIVAINDEGYPEVAIFYEGFMVQKQKYIDEWSVKPI